MSGLKNPHYYVALFIYYLGCKTRIVLITRKLRCVWQSNSFSPACIITAYNNSTQHARSSSDEPNQSAFERGYGVVK